MRLSTRAHGIFDLLFGAVLIISPWLGGFGPERAGIALSVAGLAIVALALITNFELGRFYLVQVPVHLWADGLIGLLLALSPWLVGFDRNVWIPHVAAGIILCIAAFLTNTVPARDRRGGATRAP